MTQQEIDRYFEERKLVFKDICGRLPYIVHVQLEDNKYSDPLDTNHLQHFMGYTIFKPYLFPLSSISEDLKNELYNNLTELELKALNGEIEHSAVSAFEIDFYHKHHIDYRGLIPMGLAIDATGLDIY